MKPLCLIAILLAGCEADPKATAIVSIDFLNPAHAAIVLLILLAWSIGHYTLGYLAHEFRDEEDHFALPVFGILVFMQCVSLIICFVNLIARAV